MKKSLIIIAIAAVTVTALGISGFAYAQSQFSGMMGGFGPGTMNGYGDGMFEEHGQEMLNGHGQGMPEGHGQEMQGRHGPEMMDGYGEGMDGMMGSAAEMEQLHAYMSPSMAQALGLTPEEFDARHEAGESFWDIAEAQGLSSDEALDLMTTARDSALAEAVADGVITQEFADQMTGHMGAMQGAGFGPGGDHCGGEGHGEYPGNDF